MLTESAAFKQIRLESAAASKPPPILQKDKVGGTVFSQLTRAPRLLLLGRWPSWRAVSLGVPVDSRLPRPPCRGSVGTLPGHRVGPRPVSSYR